MLTQPQSQARPTVHIQFPGFLDGRDWGHLYRKFEFRAMMNGGYIIRCTMQDAHYNLLNKLLEADYFKKSRNTPVPVRFQILASPEGKYPKTATRPQTAYLLSANIKAGPADMGLIEFVAIDPPSWFLNKGDAAGGVYKGRVDQVMKKVIDKYAPDVNAVIGRTVDSEENKWWMLRQDPKTFIGSLLEWSASITQRRTNWLVEMDGNNMWVREQAVIPSRPRAFYRYYASKDIDTIQTMEVIADNALSVVEAKLLTAGASGLSGRYLDRITDRNETKVVVKDATTANKQIVRTNAKRSFTKPDDSSNRVGWSQIMAIPEIGSAGDLGVNYDDYVDGRARGLWLGMLNNLLRAKFTVLGHGEWSDSRGLGVDTMFIKWTSGKSSEQGNTFWWPTGNWLVYGFHHVVSPKSWTTDVYAARQDYNAMGKLVGGADQ
jgi:hypothetical protein